MAASSGLESCKIGLLPSLNEFYSRHKKLGDGLEETIAISGISQTNMAEPSYLCLRPY